MYNELPIKTPMGEFSVFLQQGFYNMLGCSPFHNHNYVEVHLILDGDATFLIQREKYEIRSGSMLFIPRKTLHACIKQDENTKHTAFQINYVPCEEISRPAVLPIDKQLLYVFFDEILQCRETRDHTTISAFVSLFFCRFCKNERLESNQVIDYGFAIHEFFSKRYNEDIRLCDLAETLHLSERQTERLVLEHMGKTFRKALASTRVMIAKQLLLFSDLSLREIAEYVGYRSYAGFWKAMQNFDQP